MKKFKIPTTPPIPNDVVEEVEKAIQGKDCTFSAFVIAVVKAALDDLKSE